jgi:transglutaminase-like putative cysteine protease
MAAFALSSHNSRDLRSGVLAAAAALLVLSVADDRAQVMALCGIGLLPLALSWSVVRQLLALDEDPTLLPLLAEPRHRPWSVAAVLRLAVLTAALALLMPSEPVAHLHGGGSDTQANLPGLRGYAIGMSDEGLDLRQRGTLDANPVLQVPADSPTLWQGSYVDHYTGSSWTRTDRPDAETYPWTLLPRTTPLPTGPDLTSSLVRPVGQYISFLVYSPGPIVAVDGVGGRLRSQHDGAVQLLNPQGQQLPYTVVWRAPGSGSAGTLSADQLPVTDPRWLALPAELPSRVRTLARSVTAAAVSVPDKVRAVETYLRTHEKYQLDSPVPADGVDAVDAFLFTDHVGFCEQFASAEAVMLRSLGIPARVATGYAYSGVPGPDGTRVYRNQDAHAWVQVGYSGEKWINSDPTAGSQLAAASTAHSLVSWLKRLWHDLTGTATARRLTALGLVTGAVLVWLLFRLVRRWRSRRRPATAVPAVLETDAGRAYQRLLARLAEQKRPRQSTETVRDLLVRLKAPQRDVVAGVLEGEWYGRAVAMPAQRVSYAVAVLDDLATEAPTALSP